jgi:hypothetical protein
MINMIGVILLTLGLGAGFLVLFASFFFVLPYVLLCDTLCLIDFFYHKVTQRFSLRYTKGLAKFVYHSLFLLHPVSASSIIPSIPSVSVAQS